MTRKIPAGNQNARGLQGSGHADLRDDRQGAYDPVANQTAPDTNQQSAHERAQLGADLRGEPLPARNAELPEGLNAESGATRTPFPAEGGQHSGDCGHRVMAA
jgi:hypothetical protein